MSPNNYILNGERVSADVYNKAKYEDLRVRVPKGRKADVQAHAEAHGESVNAFINRAISEAIKRDKTASGAAERPTEQKEEDA